MAECSKYSMRVDKGELRLVCQKYFTLRQKQIDRDREKLIEDYLARMANCGFFTKCYRKLFGYTPPTREEVIEDLKKSTDMFWGSPWNRVEDKNWKTTEIFDDLALIVSQGKLTDHSLVLYDDHLYKFMEYREK